MAFRAPCRALLLLAGIAGCGGSAPIELHTWMLTIEGQAAVESVVLPTRLDDGRLPDERLRYRLRTTASVPPAWRTERLQLVLPDLAAVVQLRVDGVLATDLNPSSKGYRRRGPHAWGIAPDAASDGTLELELEVEHTWSQSAWWGTVPRFLPAADDDPAATRVYIFNLLASGAALIALLQIALASLMIYLSDRRRRVYLPFCVQGVIATFYPMFVAGWTQHVLGVYDAPALAITLVLACTVSIHFTHEFFGLGRPWRGFWWLCAVVCATAIVFSDPFITTRVTGIVTVVGVSIVMVYQVLVCARLVRRGPDRRSALYSLMSWLILVVTGLPDFMWWLGFGDVLGGVRLASIGLAWFAVFLSLLLGQKHVHSLKSSDSLNAELARRVRQLELRRSEIEVLNEELRRQIADRASQIYSAVALAGTRSVTAHLAVGEVVQGRYRVERPIGSGGMGTIYEVTRLSDGRKLALKLPREVHGESLARLAREAHIASTLSHPNVVTIVDVDVASAGFLFLVMELVEGTSLQGHRDRFGDTVWAVPVLRQIADGLAALHRVGIVHRDLKPGNVLVTPLADGAAGIKISDFGISLQPDSDGCNDPLPAPGEDLSEPVTTPHVQNVYESPTQMLPNRRNRKGASKQASVEPGRQPARPRVATSSFLTRTGHIPGTPLYMAPELAGGRKTLSPAADIFAFGVIAYELLTGRRPFSEPPVLAVLERRAIPAPSAIEHDWPECPGELARVLAACLSLSPGDRPTATEIVVVLANTATSASVHAAG